MNLTTLTSGLFGSITAALATFAAAKLTISRARRADHRREVLERAARQRELQREVVAGVIGTLSALEREVRWSPLLPGHSSARLLEATMRFYLSMYEDHSAVAEWLLNQHKAYDTALRRWNRWRLPIGNGGRAEELGTTLGELVAILVAWSCGKINDQPFVEGRTTRQVLAAHATNHPTAADPISCQPLADPSAKPTARQAPLRHGT